MTGPMSVSCYVTRPMIVSCYMTWAHDHIMLYGIAIAMSDAMVLVLSIYWGNGANSFAENPVLMILNHSYVIFLMPFEIALSGIAIEAKHYFIFFLPFHLSWSLILLPICQLNNLDAYNLPLSYKDNFGITMLVVIASILPLFITHLVQIPPPKKYTLLTWLLNIILEEVSVR